MPGNFSSCNGMTNNIGIALGTVIQTAIGGSGNDKILGYGNQIGFGGAGNDQLYFTGAQNQLFGGSGNDWLGVSGDNNTHPYPVVAGPARERIRCSIREQGGVAAAARYGVVRTRGTDVILTGAAEKLVAVAGASTQLLPFIP
jgi:hypothetical protein